MSQVTAVPLVPPVAVLLAKDPRTRQYDLTGVQTIMSGAAPMDATLEQEVLTATGAQDLRQGNRQNGNSDKVTGEQELRRGNPRTGT